MNDSMTENTSTYLFEFFVRIGVEVIVETSVLGTVKLYKT